VNNESGDIVHFGFASFNQDNLRISGKHWLYQVKSIENPLSIGYPTVGEVLTFGRHFRLGGTTTDGVAGGCGLGTALPPLSLPTDLRKLDRFAKLEPGDSNGDGYADTYASTTLWLKVSGTTYRLVLSMNNGDFRPNQDIEVLFALSQLKNSPVSCNDVTSVGTAKVKLSYVNEFIMSDEDATSSAQLDQCSGNEKGEATDGVGWTWQDASAINTCGAPKPFSGAGWESNYDSSPLPADPVLTGQTDLDPVCAGCTYSYKIPTRTDAGFPTTRALDYGDILPYHWNSTHRNEFFRRLAPNWFQGAALSDLELRAAPYFKDVPNASGYLELRDTDQKPLVAYGASPLGGAVADFRCWYLGTDDPKCKANLQPFDIGWANLAALYDPEFGCRKPYLIVVGDGESQGNNNDPTSAVANLSKNLVKTWAIDYGGDCAPNGTYHSLANAGDGECVAPANQADLVTTLRKIIGVIIEATKSFSSAAVPTVQADVADRVFLSNFTPLDDPVAPDWIGHINAFLKPVPLTTANTPDTSAAALCPTTQPACSTPNSTAGCPTNSVCTASTSGNFCMATACFLWDGGAAMQSQVQPIANQFGTGVQQRRVYYDEWLPAGQIGLRRHYFNQRAYGSDAAALRQDFLFGLGLTFTKPELSSSTNQMSQDIANTVVQKAMALHLADLNKPPTAITTDDTPFILGDVFHSNPVVVGSPSNTSFFATNVNGYRDFSNKHQKRRKLLLAGANDGMLHAFDAGVYDSVTKRFTNGSGREVFAFVPRSVLPTIKSLYNDGQNRTWSVDGSVEVADVRIDPAYNGTPDPEGANGPEWRTVVIGGLREGGVGYYALDITQPDTLDASNIPTAGAGNYVASCAGTDSGTAIAGCGPLPYPAELWEFRDGIDILDGSTGQVVDVAKLDEDTDTNGNPNPNGSPDLAAGWSTPNIGRIRVMDNGTAVDKYVAIFGGGLDKTEVSGNWIYMVDIETGQTLYKQQVVGSVPAEPAAVDTDSDGYLDRIYFGTTHGYLYRVDLRGANKSLPALADVTVSAKSRAGVTYTKTLRRITDPAFAPRIIFKAQPTPSTAVTPPRPVYYRASVIFIAALRNSFAIAFGTGDRDDLFNRTTQPGRFYVFRDDIAVTDKTTLFTEADLQAFAPTDSPSTIDYLTDPSSGKHGWYLTLNPDEKLITNPFALSGIIVFTGFTPDPATVTTTGGGQNQTSTCRLSGTSRIFAVTATNANGLLIDTYGNSSRFTQIRDFVTDPYTEQGLTKNPALAATTTRNADQFPTGSHLADVLKNLQKLFPPNCKFGNFRIDVKTLSSDTGVVFIAPVPVCIIQKNWKEF
jgi:hypothetical protein